MNWANRLTILRIILVPVFITAILYTRLNLALVIFIAAAVTDCLDGYVARAFREKTRFGAFMDPIADKLLIGSAFISFSIVKDLPGYLKIPAYVPIVIISRDVIILLGVICLFMLSHRDNIEIKPTMISKITTVFQMITVISLLIKFVYSSWLWNITVILTVISGLDYLRIGSKQINARS
jgi:cardiolipin synthase